MYSGLSLMISPGGEPQNSHLQTRLETVTFDRTVSGVFLAPGASDMANSSCSSQFSLCCCSWDLPDYRSETYLMLPLVSVVLSYKPIDLNPLWKSCVLLPVTHEYRFSLSVPVLLICASVSILHPCLSPLSIRVPFSCQLPCCCP